MIDLLEKSLRSVQGMMIVGFSNQDIAGRVPCAVPAESVYDLSTWKSIDREK